VDYICSTKKHSNLKEYYYKVKDVIKNTELIFNGDTLNNLRSNNREVFIINKDAKMPYGKQLFWVDDIDDWESLYSSIP
jgi:hypothetical protein